MLILRYRPNLSFVGRLRQTNELKNDCFIKLLLLGLFATLLVLGYVYSGAGRRQDDPETANGPLRVTITYLDFLAINVPPNLYIIAVNNSNAKSGRIRLMGMLPLNDSELDALAKIDAEAKGRGNQLKMSAEDAALVGGVDLLAEKIDAKFAVSIKDVKITQNKILLMGRDVFYREALPPANVVPSNQSAVLLHGMHFKSLTWENLTTIGLLAAMGHRVVAFDLPGFGETAGEPLVADKRGDFLNEALTKLHLINPVVVSPSMSGSYSLPYLFKYPGKMGGFVPVAPITTEQYSIEEYQTVKTPTLIIYGELDTLLGENSTKHLRNIPNSQVQMLKDAKHPAYLDQPATFHTLLYNFFLILRKK